LRLAECHPQYVRLVGVHKRIDESVNPTCSTNSSRRRSIERRSRSHPFRAVEPSLYALQ
jgi:ribosomal protein L31